MDVKVENTWAKSFANSWNHRVDEQFIRTGFRTLCELTINFDRRALFICVEIITGQRREKGESTREKSQQYRQKERPI